jgi:hypothetical protein
MQSIGVRYGKLARLISHFGLTSQVMVVLVPVAKQEYSFDQV